MLKKFSVLILAAIQILFCIGLTAIEPTKEWLIENKGTVYNLKVSAVSYDVNYYAESMNMLCCIECEWNSVYDEGYNDVMKGEYAVIETDENGISHLAYRTEKRPETDNYVKDYFPIRHRGWYIDTEATEEVTQKLSELGINRHYSWSTYEEYTGGHDITYDVKIYKGLYRVDGLSVDGIPIEEILA